MLNERNIESTREDLREQIFLDRYQRLLSWAMRLTNYHRASAEDLVQDAFIQFTRGRTSLETIENVDGYLRQILRYLHLARVTRVNEQIQKQALSIADYDCLSFGVPTLDIQEQMQVREQLVSICRYACLRKETSRAGSVLILRFFHEYLPSEIAKLLGRPRHCVDEWQRLARIELKLYLENPNKLRFVRSKSVVTEKASITRLKQNDLISDLRQMIFDSRQGDCLSSDLIRDIYVLESLNKLTTAALAHIVSCQTCLDAANQILGLPSLSERFVVENKYDEGPPDDKSQGNGSANLSQPVKRTLEKGLQKVVHHKPKQLRVFINGTSLSSVTVNSVDCELELTLSATDELRFIEVVSEQNISLLFFVVKNSRPAHKDFARIELSEGRILESWLFQNKLNVRYQLPKPANTRTSLRLLTRETSEALHDQKANVSGVVSAKESKVRRTWLQRILCALKSFVYPRANNSHELDLVEIPSPKIDCGWWTKSALVTAVALASILLFVAVSLRTASLLPPTPNSLLQQAVLVERRPGVAGQVTHRVINLEERRPGESSLITRYKVETWEDDFNKRRTDRIYDGNSQLLAERLQSNNGTQRFYHHPQADPRLAQGLLSVEEFWQLQLTAQAFIALAGDNAQLTMKQQSNAYEIHYAGPYALARGTLLQATITLRLSDLHPIKQNLLIEREGELTEFNFVETGFEQVPGNDVDAGVFESISRTATLAPASTNSNLPESRTKNTLHTFVASEELEVEVAYLLDKAKEDRSEQITLLRDAKGLLRVEGIVETNSRKQDLLHALAPFLNNPSVLVNIRSANEISGEHRGRQTEWSTTQQTESVPETIAVDQELRAYFSKSNTATTKTEISSDERYKRISLAVNDFASKTANRSYRALFHALELKQIVDRFQRTDMRDISPGARMKWLEMIRSHAAAFQRECAIFQVELKPIFQIAAARNPGPAEAISNDQELIAIVAEVTRLARTNNEAIRAAFVITTKSSDGALKSTQFWQDLSNAEQLAERIQKYR